MGKIGRINLYLEEGHAALSNSLVTLSAGLDLKVGNQLHIARQCNLIQRALTA